MGGGIGLHGGDQVSTEGGLVQVQGQFAQADAGQVGVGVDEARIGGRALQVDVARALGRLGPWRRRGRRRTAMLSSRISTAWAVGAAATPVWIGPPWIRMSPANAGAMLAPASRAARARMRRTVISEAARNGNLGQERRRSETTLGAWDHRCASGAVNDDSKRHVPLLYSLP
jgi:hypothetical protein